MSSEKVYPYRVLLITKVFFFTKRIKETLFTSVNSPLFQPVKG